MAQASQMLAWVSLGLENDHFAPFLVAFVSGSNNQTSTLSDPSALRCNWCQTP